MRLPFKVVTILFLLLLLMDVSLVAASSVTTYDWGLMQGYQGNNGTLTNQMKIVLPLYSFENITWARAIKGAPAVGIMIMNPDSGPGVFAEPNILSLVESAQHQGIRVLGYISTGYANGAVTIRQAEQEIDDYYAWYHVSGILFDEANNVCAPQAVSYYSTLYNYTKSKPGPDIVILNPGTATGMCYEPISDILVIFEGNYSSYVNNYPVSDWVQEYSSSHFLAVVYSADSVREMQNAVRLASDRNTGLIYITNLGNNDALGTLPSYFSQEVATVSPNQSPDSPESYLISVALVVFVGAAFVLIVRYQRIFRDNRSRRKLLLKKHGQAFAQEKHQK